MGKSKKRIFNKNTDLKGSILKREKIINQVINDIRTDSFSEKAINLIGLFGITYEELSEAGASFEELSAIKNVF